MLRLFPYKAILAGWLGVAAGILFTLSCCFPGAAAAESHLAEIKARGVLRVGMFAVDLPPFYFVNKDTGEMTGYDVDLAKNLAHLIGVKLDIQRFGPPYAKLTDAVDDGTIDLLISYASITPQREEKYATVVYEYTNFGFLMDLDKLEKNVGREFIGPEDLNIPEVKIIVQGNTPFVAILKKFFPNSTPINHDTNNDVQVMVDAMDKGEACVSFDRELVFLIYSRLDAADFRRFLMHPLPEIVNPVGMMIRKGSDLAPLIQEYVDNRDDTLELTEIIDKYMKFWNNEGTAK